MAGTFHKLQRPDSFSNHDYGFPLHRLSTLGSQSVYGSLAKAKEISRFEEERGELQP